MRSELINNIRNKLKKNQISIGSWMQLNNTSIAQILGKSGFDWITLDLEHGIFSNKDLPDIFSILEANDTLALVRVTDKTESEFKRVLDYGAGGVIIPKIESKHQLEKYVNYCCWPPTGKRGVAFNRANNFGSEFSIYKNEAQSPFIVPMIETLEGVENLEQILEVGGIDAVFIGPYDLSASMGITGNFDSVEFTNTITRIKTVCSNFKISCGIHVVEPNESDLQNVIKNGYSFIAYSIDTVMLRKMADLNDFRKK